MKEQWVFECIYFLIYKLLEYSSFDKSNKGGSLVHEPSLLFCSFWTVAV